METAIRQLIATRPFEKFQIRLANGDRYTIDAPDLAMLDSYGMLEVFRRKSGTANGRIRIAVVAIPQIVSLVEDSDDFIGIPY